MSPRLVWAQSTNGVIGVAGTLPWHLPEDLKHFSRLTTGSVVVMGRRTWESLPPRFRPLPGRTNVVLTRSPGYDAPGAEVVGSVDEALARHPEPWVIGGAEVYAAFVPAAGTAVVTTVDLVVDETGDGVVRAPVLGPGWAVADRVPAQGWSGSTTGLGYAVTTYTRL
ncbi:MAG: dihydrofolate reductase [Actinobacteria bacterium]|nr:dihydrofolate reductase [Actinomycetota bacterium]